MKKDRTSLTAIGIAVMRAVESERPPDERLLFDPYARQFVPAWMFHVLSFFIRSGYTDWRGPGVGGFLAARDRYIDDYLLECLDAAPHQRPQQLVLLGAGYDARPYRFQEQLSGVHLFEVDHPATQADKLAKLERIFGQRPQQVTFIPIDFNTHSLESRLREGGYDPAVRTLFIWQGVTMYLTTAAVQSTLAFIAGCSAPGSAVIFDYMDRRLLDRRQTQAEVKNMRRYRFLTGEGLCFGLRPIEVESYLRSLGFHAVRNADAAELRRRYCTGKNADRKIAEGYGIAVGIV